MVLEPLYGLLVADPLEGLLGRLEVGVQLGDQVAQGMFQHSATTIINISNKEIFNSPQSQTARRTKSRSQTGRCHAYCGVWFAVCGTLGLCGVTLEIVSH